MEITQPRVARPELPWEPVPKPVVYPEGVISTSALTGGTFEMRPSNEAMAIEACIPAGAHVTLARVVHKVIMITQSASHAALRREGRAVARSNPIDP